MALKIFNKTNSSYKKDSGFPTMSFAIKGANRISRSAVQSLGLKEGDKVSIAYDEKDKRTLYLFVDKKEGFPLRGYGKDGGLAFNNVAISKVVAENFTDERNSILCRLVIESQTIDGLTVWPIIVPKQ